MHGSTAVGPFGASDQRCDRCALQSDRAALQPRTLRSGRALERAPEEMASIADLPILSAADFYARDGAGPEAGSRCVIGVLALQGAFLEHLTYLRACGAQAREVRTAKDFDGIDGLVIPGGESTAMALVAARTGMVRWRLVLRDASQPAINCSCARARGEC